MEEEIYETQDLIEEGTNEVFEQVGEKTEETKDDTKVLVGLALGAGTLVIGGIIAGVKQLKKGAKEDKVKKGKLKFKPKFKVQLFVREPEIKDDVKTDDNIVNQ